MIVKELDVLRFVASLAGSGSFVERLSFIALLSVVAPQSLLGSTSEGHHGAGRSW